MLEIVIVQMRSLLKTSGDKCSTSLDNLKQDKQELEHMRQEVASGA